MFRILYPVGTCAVKKTDLFAIKSPIKKLSVLVPVYNEETTLVQAITSLNTVLESLGRSFEIIIVESNSEDNSRNLLKLLNREIEFRLIYEEIPKGKGSAIRLAMRYMSGDVFMIYDADLEYSPNDIPKLIDLIESGRTSFVLGTRHLDGMPIRVMKDHFFMPLILNQAHKFFTFILNMSLGVKMTDPFTMYKVYRSEIFRSVNLYSNRFDLDWELVIKAILKGSVPYEVPVSYKSRSFSEGKKVKVLRDPISWIVAFFRFRYFEKYK